VGAFWCRSLATLDFLLVRGMSVTWVSQKRDLSKNT